MSVTAIKTTKPKKQKERPGWMVWGIPKKLQQAFKIKCIRNGVSMKAALEGLLEEYVHGKKEEQT